MREGVKEGTATLQRTGCGGNNRSDVQTQRETRRVTVVHWEINVPTSLTEYISEY